MAPCSRFTDLINRARLRVGRLLLAIEGREFGSSQVPALTRRAIRKCSGAAGAGLPRDSDVRPNVATVRNVIANFTSLTTNGDYGGGAVLATTASRDFSTRAETSASAIAVTVSICGCRRFIEACGTHSSFRCSRAHLVVEESTTALSSRVGSAHRQPTIRLRSQILRPHLQCRVQIRRS